MYSVTPETQTGTSVHKVGTVGVVSSAVSRAGVKQTKIAQQTGEKPSWLCRVGISSFKLILFHRKFVFQFIQLQIDLVLDLNLIWSAV